MKQLIGKVLVGEQKKREKDLYSVTKGSEYRQEVDGINFDGHRVLWGFSYEPYTYLKESELSGEEWRKGGYVRFFKDGIQVFEDFCRKPDNAVFRIASLLYKLQELSWSDIKEGTKIYWRDTPCVIERVILGQGAMLLKAEEGHKFPNPVWAKEDWQKIEDPTEVKVDLLDPHIWWHR